MDFGELKLVSAQAIQLAVIVVPGVGAGEENLGRSGNG